MSANKPKTLPIKVPEDRWEYHRPVLMDEVLAALAPAPGRTIVDGTLGGGGHSSAILQQGAKIVGLDQDQNAIDYCIHHLAIYDADSVRLVRANFRDLGRVLDHLNISKVDGILLDLGVSSRQLDSAERGFSFQKSGPLDMRMDRSASLRAFDVVNDWSETELTRIFRSYGEEPAAARVAAAIVKARCLAPIEDTFSLVRIVETVIPKRGPKNPATRVFQALRIAVNDELGAVAAGLEAATERLNPAGRLAVITFHSLEDRLVKQFCRETSAPTIDRPEWPAPRPNPRYAYRALSRRAISPSEAELAANPRSRSAKLRALEKIS